METNYINDYPWYNVDTKYNFYAVILLNYDTVKRNHGYSVLFGDELIFHNINAFTTNEYLFKMYMSFYSKYLNNESTITFVVEQSTFSEFVKFSESKYNVFFSSQEWIQLDEMPLSDNYILYNDNMQMEISESIYETGYDYNNMFMEALCGGQVLFDEYGEYFKPQFDSIKKLMKKVVETYIFIEKLTENQSALESIQECLSESQIKRVSDEFGLANPITDYQYYDFICEPYLMLHYINNTTSLFEDVEEVKS